MTPLLLEQRNGNPFCLWHAVFFGCIMRIRFNTGIAALVLIFVSSFANAVSIITSPSGRLGSTIEQLITKKADKRGYAGADPRLRNKPAANDADYHQRTILNLSNLVSSCARPIGLNAVACILGLGATGVSAYYAINQSADLAMDIAKTSNGDYTFKAVGPKYGILVPESSGCPLRYINGSPSSDPTDCDWSYILTQIGAPVAKIYPVSSTYQVSVQTYVTTSSSTTSPYTSTTVIDGHTWRTSNIYQNKDGQITRHHIFSLTRPASSGTDENPVTAEQILPRIPDSLRQTQLNDQLLADAANRLWQNSAAQPGYNGIPYDAADPITADEVAEVRQAFPEMFPRIDDLARPAFQGSRPLPVNLSSSSSDGTGSGTGTGTTSTLKLPDPESIGLDALPESPNFAAKISGFVGQYAFTYRNRVVQCPTWNLNLPIVNRQFVIDYHCTVEQQYGPLIRTVITVAFSILALIIVLSA